MLEFELKRSKKGKRPRWAKKYPRKRILKKGSEKAAGWYFHNWYDDNIVLREDDELTVYAAKCNAE